MPLWEGRLRSSLLMGLSVACLTGSASVPLAGQWVEPPGEGWAALAVFRQDTREIYGLQGENRSFFAEGHAQTTSSFLTLAGGLFPGVDAWAQFSYHRLNFDDLSEDRLSTGLGDVRMWLRAAPLSWVGVDFPIAIRGGVKLPLGDFDVNSEIIPLGDGQRDWEVMAEVGHSLYPRSVYVMGWVGYRWREINNTSKKDFGNEVFYFAQVGGTAGPISYKVAIDGWDGASGVIEGIPVPSAQRDLLQIQPSLMVPVGPGVFEVGARFTLSGRNIPSGTALMLGYFTDWSWF